MKRFRYWFIALAVIVMAPMAFGGWENSPWDSVIWKKILNATTGKIEIKTDIDGDGTNEVTITEDGSLSVGGTNPLLVDTDGDGDIDVIGGQYLVDLGTDNTYTITATSGEYLFDIDALDSNCTVTLPEASLWMGKTIVIRLDGSNATADLFLHPGDATDRYKDWDRATDLTSAADEYIAADGDGEVVVLQSQGADLIVILNADGALPTGWAQE